MAWWDDALKGLGAAGNYVADAALGTVPGLGAVYNASKAVKAIGGANNPVHNTLKNVGAYDVASTLHDATQGNASWGDAAKKAGAFGLGVGTGYATGGVLGAGIGGQSATMAANAAMGGDKATTPASATGSQNNTLAELLKQQMAQQQAYQQKLDQQMSDVRAMANPYDTNSASFQGALRGAANNVNQNFIGAEQNAMAGLAGRGMVGSGQEAAVRSGLAGARGAAMAGAQNSLYADAANRAAAFEQNRQGTLANLLAGARVDPTSLATNIAQMDQDAYRYEIGRQDAANAAMGNTIGGIAKVGIENWDKLAPYAQGTWNWLQRQRQAGGLAAPGLRF